MKIKAIWTSLIFCEAFKMKCQTVIGMNLNLLSPRDANPEIDLEQIWVEDNLVSTGVKIVELNSSDNPVTSPEDDRDKRNRNSWIYGNQQSFQEGEDYYKANESARERRRIRNQYGDYFPSHKQTEYEGFVCPGFYGPTENVIFDHQMNCFTILDKHFIGHSESSSENDYSDIEEFSCGVNAFGQCTAHDDSNMSNNVGEMKNSQKEPDMQKRTVWIYSFKNRHRLNETDFDMNIPGCDTSNSSFEETEELTNEIQRRSYRLATPIPPAHVPKLNLTISPKLPTVTEVSESQKVSSANQTDKTFDEMLKPKPFNNWFRSENATPHSAEYNRNKNTCIINWMALSPRDRKRKITHPSPVRKGALPTLREVSSFAEKKLQNPEQCNESNKSSTSKVETEAEIHVESSTSHKTTEIENVEAADETTYMQLGGHETRELKSKERIRKLQIRFSPKPILNVSEITEPIEKLEGHNWIVEDNKYAHVPYYYRYEVKVDDPEEKIKSETTGNTLLIRNMSLLKPAHWTEYLPITGSIPSLHLSMNTDSVSDIERQSWIKRVTKWFRCCK